MLLDDAPRGVAQARRWVEQACLELDRPDLLDCAQLGVSELVTNALLHAAAPIELQLRGTAEEPRFEVHDSAPQAPVFPSPPPEDAPLATVGRGLSIVARAARSWGAELRPEGKSVWFSPRAQLSEVGVPALLTGPCAAVAARPGPPSSQPVRVLLLGVPPRSFGAFGAHLDELAREIHLMARAKECDSPDALELATSFVGLERHVRAIDGGRRLERARDRGQCSVDLVVETSRPTTRALARFAELLDLADELCRDQRLLTLARTPAERAFHEWLLGEFVGQGEGEDPVRWPGTTTTDDLAPQSGRSAEPRSELAPVELRPTIRSVVR